MKDKYSLAYDNIDEIEASTTIADDDYLVSFDVSERKFKKVEKQYVSTSSSSTTDYNSITIFTPDNKYSPLKMLPADGYANGEADNGIAAAHDASGGAVPSFTTAKKRQICVVTVAGTFNGIAVGVNDFLMANQDNPTTAAHWDIIKDSTDDFETAVDSMQGDELYLYGTYLINTANPTQRVNLAGEYTILNLCGYPAIYQTNNNTRAAEQTPRQCASAGLGVGQGLDVDDDLGNKLQQVTYFTLTTAADAENFLIGTKVEVFTDAYHPSADGSQKGYISNAFEVVSVDLAGGIVYADSVLEYHNEIANATNIYLIPLHEDKATIIREGSLFMGAPTVIGGEVGWWLTLEGTDYQTATISGSSTTRTLTMAGGVPSYLTAQGVRIVVDSDSIFTMEITETTATTITGTIENGKNDRGVSETCPTSGSVTFVPAFYTSEFDNTTHGGAIVLQQAHGSKVKTNFARLWAAGVRCRYSHFCETDVYASKVVNIGTGISGKSWRLLYMAEDYSSSRNRHKVRGCGGRHAYTSSSGETSIAWAADLWMFRSGCTCRPVADIETTLDTGAACDTHSMTNGASIKSKVEFVTSYNTAHSYRGIGGQLRGENHTITHEQRGGQIGLRVANGADYARSIGCIDNVQLKVADMPVRDDGFFFASNLPVGFLMQSQSAYTGGTAGYRTLAKVSASYANIPCGNKLESYTKADFNKVEFDNIGYVAEWLQDQAVMKISHARYSYSNDRGISFTSSTSLSVGSGSKVFTVTAGQDISVGQGILVRAVAAHESCFMRGRVVSYSGTTLTLYIDGYKGSGTYASWRLITDIYATRYGIAMGGASEYYAGVVDVELGVGGNPSSIFCLPIITATTSTGISFATDTITLTSALSSSVSVGYRVSISNAANSANNLKYYTIASIAVDRLSFTLTGASFTTESAGNAVSLIFYEATATKTAQVGILNVKDPHGVGMPALYPAELASDFSAVNIGVIIYNGQIVSGGVSSPKSVSRVTFSALVSSSATWTNMPLAETLVNGSSRHIRKVDLTGYSQVRIVGNIQTAGVAASIIYPKYKSTYDTVVGNYTNLSSGACEFVLTNTGGYESSWVDIATAAKTDVYLCLAGSGGDGATSPATGTLALEFR